MLKGNQITDIARGSLNGLYKLNVLDIRNNKVRSFSEDVLDAVTNISNTSVYFEYYSKFNTIGLFDYCSFCVCKLNNVLEQNRSAYMFFPEHSKSCCSGHEWKSVHSDCKAGNKCDRKTFRSITCTNSKFEISKPKNVGTFPYKTRGNHSFSKTINKDTHRRKASSRVRTPLGKQTKKSRQSINNKKEIDEAFNVGISFVFPVGSILLSALAYAIWRINKNRKKKKQKKNREIEDFDLFGNATDTPSTNNQTVNRTICTPARLNIPEITVTSAEVFDMFTIPQITITTPGLSNPPTIIITQCNEPETMNCGNANDTGSNLSLKIHSIIKQGEE